MKHLLKEFVKKEFPEISYSLLDLSHVNFFKRIYKTFPLSPNLTLIFNDNQSPFMHDSDTLVKSWHMKHMISHRTHYSFFSRRLNNICQMQKDPFYPVFHFPTISSEQVTMGKSHKIELQCRLICESDFTFNLMTWNSFHLAKYFFNPMVPLVINEPNNEEILTLNSEKSILNALRNTRLSALSVALLILEEEFTFADLLKVILSLSNYGVLGSMLYQKRLINQQLELNWLDLSSVYLPLLNSLTVRDKNNLHSPLNLRKLNIQYLQVPESLQTHLDVKDKKFSDDFLTKLQETTYSLTEHKMSSIFQSSHLCMKSTWNATNLKEIKQLSDSLLSSSFILKNSMTEEMKNELFQTLPTALRTEAINKAGTLRLLSLLSPKSFMFKQSVSEFWLAKPKPYDVVPLKQSLVRLHQRANWIVKRRRFLNGGFKFMKRDLKTIFRLISSVW